MTNELANVPELRFPEYSEEWEKKRLKDISKINPKLMNEFPSEFDYIDLESVYKGKINKVSRVTNENAPSRAQRVAQRGDVFFQTVRPYQQNNFVFLDDRYSTVVSTGYAQIRSNMNSFYIYNLLLTSTFLNKVLINCTGSNYPAINSNDLGNISIRISTNENEKQKIGDFFSKLDCQIELEEQKLAKLEEQKKGYMQKIFSQELRFKDKNGDDYPEWMETNIRNTFDNKGGTALEKEFDNNGTHKVISIGSYSMNSTYNEQNIRINKNEFTEKYLLNEGDLAMVLNDKTKEGNIIGRSIYIDEDDKYIYNQRTERLIPVTGNNHKFLWYLMNSEQFRKKIKQMMQGATQVYINYNSIKDLSIYLPILEEQNKIENFLGDIFNIIKNQSDKVELLKRRKKGFLQKMFV